MKFTYHIPVQQYGFLEITGEGYEELADATEKYNDYAEVKINRTPYISPTFNKVTTFTGEEILYDSEKHLYTDLEGNHLVSGSEYKKSLETPFDINTIAPKTAKSKGISEQDLRDMWSRNGNISTGLGTTLHKVMEQWFKHRKNGTDKNYHLPKHPFLKSAIETFPLKDAEGLPELFVSDVANKRVGQIDLLVVTGEKEGYIVDYKTDAEVKKNVEGHFNQLSFYAHILIAKGWSIPKVEVWNYTDSWTNYESPVLNLK